MVSIKAYYRTSFAEEKLACIEIDSNDAEDGINQKRKHQQVEDLWCSLD